MGPMLPFFQLSVDLVLSTIRYTYYISLPVVALFSSLSVSTFLCSYLSLSLSFFLSVFLIRLLGFSSGTSLVWYLFVFCFCFFLLLSVSFSFSSSFFFCVVLCFLCGLCPRVESLFVVVTCDHGICISQDESIGTEFGCTGWLSEWKDRFNVTIIQYNTILRSICFPNDFIFPARRRSPGCGVTV